MVYMEGKGGFGSKQVFRWGSLFKTQDALLTLYFNEKGGLCWEVRLEEDETDKSWKIWKWCQI